MQSDNKRVRREREREVENGRKEGRKGEKRKTEIQNKKSNSQ